MMTATAPPTPTRHQELAIRHYNAQVVGVRRCHDDLLVLRIRPDGGLPPFTPGQYTALALGYWEPRVPGAQHERPEDCVATRLAKRAYSISCSLVDDCGDVVRAQDCPYLEFYVALVRNAGHPPALTPRLFLLRRGGRLFVSPHVHGNYTLEPVRARDNVLFIATGTGEAPHNAMLAELFAQGHDGRVASVVCVRHQRDLGYLREHRRLMERFPAYRYLTLTTREPTNLDPSLPNYVGKRYLQDYLASGDLERDLGWKISPADTHVFLCGSPEMIGVPRPTHNPKDRLPPSLGMVESLEQRGFRVDQPYSPGNIHYERFW